MVVVKERPGDPRSHTHCGSRTAWGEATRRPPGCTQGPAPCPCHLHHNASPAATPTGCPWNSPRSPADPGQGTQPGHTPAHTASRRRAHIASRHFKCGFYCGQELPENMNHTLRMFTGIQDKDTVRAQIYRHPLLPNFADSTDGFLAEGVAVNKNIYGILLQRMARAAATIHATRMGAMQRMAPMSGVDNTCMRLP